MVRPLFLLLSNVGWPFAVGFIGVGEVTRCMSEVMWIYHPDFPAENGSGFMINERLLLPMAPAVFRWPLNVDVDPSWHTEPQGHAIMERWLVGDIDPPLWKKIDYRKCNYLRTPCSENLCTITQDWTSLSS